MDQGGGIMKKVLLLFIVVFLISGCEMPKETAMDTTEETEVLAEDSSALSEESFVVLEKTLEETLKEVKVEAVVLAKAEEVSVSRTADEIIKENRWGFSIYDPEAGTIDYYASDGGYLGKKSVQ